MCGWWYYRKGMNWESQLFGSPEQFASVENFVERGLEWYEL